MTRTLKTLAPLAAAIALSFGGVAHAQESESARKDKKAYVALEAVGFTMMPVNGLRAGYFINPDLIAEASYAMGSASLGDFKADKSLIEVQAKYFFGNSFYVNGGLAHESWTVKYPVDIDVNGATTSTLTGSVGNTGLSLHIGNQWQWSGFTMGCDWAGYFLSLSSSSSFKSDSSVDATNKKKEEDDVKTLVGGNSAHLLRLYAGWAF